MTDVEVSDEECREREAVYDGWHLCETLEDVEEQERLVDRYAERNPGMVDQSDAVIAGELLKMQRRAIERHGGPSSARDHLRGRISIQSCSKVHGAGPVKGA